MTRDWAFGLVGGIYAVAYFGWIGHVVWRAWRNRTTDDWEVGHG